MRRCLCCILCCLPSGDGRSGNGGRFQTVATDDYHFAPEKRLDDQRRRDGDDEHGNAVYQDEQEKEVALYVG